MPVKVIESPLKDSDLYIDPGASFPELKEPGVLFVFFQCDTSKERDDLFTFLKTITKDNRSDFQFIEVSSYDKKRNIVKVDCSEFSPVHGLDVWIQRNVSGVVEEFLALFKEQFQEEIDRNSVYLSDIVKWANDRQVLDSGGENELKRDDVKSVADASSLPVALSDWFAAVNSEDGGEAEEWKPIDVKSGRSIADIEKKSFEILQKMEVILQDAKVEKISEKDVYEKYIRRGALASAFISVRTGLFAVGMRVAHFLGVSPGAYDKEYHREYDMDLRKKLVKEIVEDEAVAAALTPGLKKVANFDDIVRWANQDEYKHQGQKTLRDAIREKLQRMELITENSRLQKIKAEEIVAAYGARLVKNQHRL